jgi:hypothetical protein
MHRRAPPLARIAPWIAASVSIASSIACGSSSNDSPAADAGDVSEAETTPIGCQPGEAIADDGHCEAAGVPPAHCGVGFQPDGNRGCVAVVPADPCPFGSMAVPGETTCHDVAPCADGTFGGIPVDATTQYVDASFTGTSDGSAKAPWKTIQAAVTAAAADAIVAIAAGSYAEDVHVGVTIGAGGKPVKLWGVCPAKVEIVGSSTGGAALSILGGAKGTEVHGLALRGGAEGLKVDGSPDVVVDGVWIHDTARRGVEVESSYGATRLSIAHTLVERASGMGMFFLASTATVDASVVRDGQVLAGDTFGEGIHVQEDGPKRSNVTVRGCLLEGNSDLGITVEASDAIIDATLIRDTRPRPVQNIQGSGIEIVDYQGQPANVTVTSSVVERSHAIGLLVGGSQATIQWTVVRDTQPRASDNYFGRGIAIENDIKTHVRSTVTLQASVVERSLDVGVFVQASDAIVTSLWVRDTQPQAWDQKNGRGIDAQPNDGMQPTLTLASTIVERSYEFGVLLDGIDSAIVDALLVRDTQSRTVDGTFGDAFSLFAETFSTSATIRSSRFERSARVGVSSFGGTVVLATSALDCNGIHLDGETYAAVDASFTDNGGNVCGCNGTPAACQVLSSGLAAPEPLP